MDSEEINGTITGVFDSLDQLIPHVFEFPVLVLKIRDTTTPPSHDLFSSFGQATRAKFMTASRCGWSQRSE